MLNGTDLGQSLVDSDILEQLEKLKLISKILNKNRLESGSLRIEIKALEFVFSSEKYPINFIIDDRLQDYYYLQEELLHLVNKLAADIIASSTAVCKHSLFLRHDQLMHPKFQDICRFLSYNKLNADFSSPFSLNEMINKTKKYCYPKYLAILLKMRNYIDKGEYVLSSQFDKPESDLSLFFNSALNFDYYTTITNPLDKYTDIIAQRLIWAHIKLSQNESSSCSDTSFLVYSDDMLNQLNLKYALMNSLNSKYVRLMTTYIIKNRPPPIYKGYVMEICFKQSQKNKRNGIQVKSNTFEASCLVIIFFIEEINMEVEWNKEEDPEVELVKFNTGDSHASIEYISGSAKLIKLFTDYEICLKVKGNSTMELSCEIIK